jgi:hypothetical protein
MISKKILKLISAAISLLQHCVGKRAAEVFEREDKYVPEGARTLN